MLCHATLTTSLQMNSFVVKNKFWSQTDVGLSPDSSLPSYVSQGKSFSFSKLRNNLHVCKVRVITRDLVEL